MVNGGRYFHIKMPIIICKMIVDLLHVITICATKIIFWTHFSLHAHGPIHALLTWQWFCTLIYRQKSTHRLNILSKDVVDLGLLQNEDDIQSLEQSLKTLLLCQSMGIIIEVRILEVLLWHANYSGPADQYLQYFSKGRNTIGNYQIIMNFSYYGRKSWYTI